MKLKRIPSVTTFAGIQQTETPTSTHQVKFHLKVPSGSVSVQKAVEAVVIDVITGDLPTQDVSTIKDHPFIQGLKLADPKFYLPGRIDFLIGADVLPDILVEGSQIRHSTDMSIHLNGKGKWNEFMIAVADYTDR